MNELSAELQNARDQDLRLVLIASMVLLVLLFLLSGEAASLLDGKANPIGTVIPEGQIRRRASRSLEWNSHSLEFPVYQNDSIYTPENTLAHIELKNGKTIELKPNSLVKLVESSSNQSEVEIVFGSANGARIKSDLEAAQLVRNIANTCRPEAALPGELPQYEDLPALPNRSPLAKDLPPPQKPILLPLDRLEFFNLKLLSPKNLSTIQRPALWVQFSWSPIPLKKTHFEIEVSQSKDFVDKIDIKQAKNGQVLLINTPGIYYARVRARLHDEELVSPVHTFKMVRVETGN